MSSTHAEEPARRQLIADAVDHDIKHVVANELDRVERRVSKLPVAARALK